MKNLFRKCRSKRGVSMILAMLYMLVCAFVGGSVLAASTANASKVANLQNQQAFLSQRSSVFLLTGQLKTVTRHRLSITDTTQTIHFGELKPNGSFEIDTSRDPVERRIITFSIPQLAAGEQYTHLEQILYESAIACFLAQNPTPAGVAQQLEFDRSFLSLPHRPSGVYSYPTDCILYKDNAVGLGGTIECSFSSVSLPSFQTQLSLATGTGNLYDFCLDFGTETQLGATLYASVNSPAPMVVDYPPSEEEIQLDDGTTRTEQVQISASIINRGIYWGAPQIEKGGSSR